MNMNEDDTSSNSFKLRVDKVFGSLSSSSSSSSSYVWSLTDDEIQKKPWNRDLNRINDDDDLHKPKPLSSSTFIPKAEKEVHLHAPSSSSTTVVNDLAQDEEDDDGDDDDDEKPSSSASELRKKKHRLSRLHNTEDEDEFDVRSSIGLDCTLDFEEEEDEFDKVALAKEDDSLFNPDITTYGYGYEPLNTCHPLPNTLGGDHLPKDPRANHLAAKLRLEEDNKDAAAAAGSNFHSLNLEDNNSHTARTRDLPLEDEDPAIPKPILKKKLALVPPKSNKRVRFDPQFDDDSNDVEAIQLASPLPPPIAANQGSRPNLPDYLKNPSSYTCYTLDSSSSDLDDEANRKAYMDFINLVKKPTSTTDDIDAVDSSKPPTFISKKPAPMKIENECKPNQAIVSQFTTPRIGIAVSGDHDNEASAMEEDEREEGVDKPKPGRQYRTRTMVDPEQQFVT